MTVCILDSNPLTTQRTSSLLKSAGYKVRPFKRPDTFLKYARNHHPAAAVVDWGGSDAQGLQIRSRLREVSPVTAVILSLKIHQGGARSMLGGDQLIRMIKQVCATRLHRDFAEAGVLN